MNTELTELVFVPFAVSFYESAMRFLFCPIGTHGYVYPSIALALGLKQRGHEVAFATSQCFQSPLQQVELERIPRADTDGQSFVVERWANPVEAALQYKHLDYALKRFPADVLVASPLTLGAYLIRERLGIPLAVMGGATSLWPLEDEQSAEPTETEKWQWWRHEDMTKHHNHARELLRAAPIQYTPSASPLLGDLFLLRSVPELLSEESYPDRVHLVGDCLWEPPTLDPELEEWLASTRPDIPLLYVQHGRAFGGPTFWHQLVEALADKPVRVVASTSRMEDKPVSVPAHFFVREFVPQRQAMTRAAGIISSATTTSVLGALVQGLPSILVPGGGEQPDLARMMVRAGAALGVPTNHGTPQLFRTYVDELLNTPRLRDRAQELQRAFARSDSPRRALGLLELLGRIRRPLTRQEARSLATVTPAA